MTTDQFAEADVQAFFAAFAAAHGREDVAAYLNFFDQQVVWVTSRGRCFRGRDALGEYLHAVIPGGLGAGGVRYVVESVHPLGEKVCLVVVEQTYLDDAGAPRDAAAAHTHTYVLGDPDGRPGGLRILAGQNTVRADDSARG